MSKPLVIANFKMNPASVRKAAKLINAIERGLGGKRNVDVVLAPPAPYLFQARRIIKRARLGAQNMHWAEHGAFTGEVSPSMLRDLGVSTILIGHSERRRLFGETDELVNRKIKAALLHGLTPIVAIGEEARESEDILPVTIREQLTKALIGISRGRLAKIIIAYEPVWAIGTGMSETPDGATRRAIYIRKILTRLLGAKIAATIRILYGGSVNAKNAASFLAEDIRGMEGLLVGGASLIPEEFLGIVAALSKIALRR